MSNQDIPGFVEDFTDDSEVAPPIPFKINDDIFYISGEPPLGALFDIAKLAGIDLSTLTEAQQAQAASTLMGFLDSVIMPESAVRFAERMRSPEHPIRIRQIVKISRWAVEQYSGKERTAQVSASLASQGATGPSSTDGAPAGVPTPGSFT